MKPMLHGTACAVGGYQVMGLLWGLRFVYQNAFVFLGASHLKFCYYSHLNMKTV